MVNLTKICRRCNTVKPITDFYRRISSSDGLRSWCKQCDGLVNKIAFKTYRIKRNAYQRQASRKRHKTKLGYLERTFSNIIARTRLTPVDRHFPFYAGVKCLFTRQEFYKFSLKDKAFKRLFKIWTVSNYAVSCRLSIDRIDSDMHYSLDNIQWISHRDNSLKANTLRLSKNVIA